MSRRNFIGPNGARFSLEEPLPRWARRRLERGEFREEAAEAGDLEGLSRAELNARAEAAGVDKPASLPNKQAVIDALREAEKAPPEPDSGSGGGEGPQKPPEPDDRPLEALSRAELDERAEAAGVADPAGMPNKGAVIEAIRQREGQG